MEMEEKRRLYFEIGVEEVWICDEQGHLRVFTEHGRTDTSRFVTNLPNRLNIRSSDDGRVRR